MADNLAVTSDAKLSFKVNSHDENISGVKARLGRLEHSERTPMLTPHYIGVTSRGAIPHLTQDMLQENTSIRGVYTAFEDCKSQTDTAVALYG